jgi:translocation and assembly module TamB
MGLHGVELGFASAVPSISGLDGELEVQALRARIASMSLEFGGAPCAVEGSVALEEHRPVFDLDLSGENLLVARGSKGKLRGDVEIALEGPPEALSVSGTLSITEGRFTQDIGLLEGLIPAGGSPAAARGFHPVLVSSGPFARAEFDVAVDSQRPVELEGSLYEVAIRPELELRGTGAVPLFEGTVYVDPSTLTLPSGKLRVQSGVVHFSREAPFAPRVSLAADLETKGYDIEARIDGPLGSPRIVLSSSPPLPNDQLLMLFLTGQPPAAANQGLATARTVGVYLAQDALARWFRGEGSSDGLLDSLTFEMGAEVSQSGASTWVARYFLDSRRRRTGRTSYLSAEKDVWDKTNFGFGLRYRRP